MPRNSSGVFTLLNAAFTPGTIISSNAVNGDLADIATGLTQSLATTGVSTMTGQIKGADGSVGAPGHSFGSDLGTGMYRPGLGQVAFAGSGVQLLTMSSTAATFAGTVSGTSFVNVNGVPASIPIGLIADFGAASAPSGWLLCAGQTVSRTTYALLFAVIGTTYGVGDGSTTFGIPDCRGRATYGQDNMGGTPANRITVAGGNFDGTVLGGTGGLQNHTLTQGELPAVSPTFTGNQINLGTLSSPTQYVQKGALIAGSAGGVVDENNASAVQITIPPFTPSGSISALGSGNAHTVLNPALIVTKIIFAGV